MAHTQLWDEIERTSLESRSHVQGSWSYINQSAREEYGYVRKIYQSWFDELPLSAENKFHLCNRFRDDNEAQHLGAFFELYVYKFLKSSNLKIDINPELASGLTPDFLVSDESGRKIYVEATNMIPDNLPRGILINQRKIIDDLNTHIQTNEFYIYIVFINSDGSPPPLRRIRLFVQENIVRFKYNDIVEILKVSGHERVRALTHFEYNSERWRIEFNLFPKFSGPNLLDPETVSSITVSSSQINLARKIRINLRDKISHYRDIGHAFLIAANISHWSCNIGDIEDALKGDLISLLHRTTGQLSRGRDRNGLWRDSHGFRNRTLSGVLFFQDLTLVNIHNKQPLLYLHPSPNYPLSDRSLLVQFLTQQNIDVANILGIDPRRMPR